MTPVFWLVQTEADVPPGDDWLAPEEVVRLGRLRFPRRRAAWRLGRWTAKRAVAACLAGPEGFMPSAIAVLNADDGAPEVFLDDQPAPFSISVSHRGGLALCAVAPGSLALGCDLEAIEPRSAAFVADYFNEHEQALIDRLPQAQHPACVNLIWSAKESALKALRTGLRLDTRRVEVHLAGPEPGDTWQPLAVCYPDGERTFPGWYRRRGSHVLTLAAHPPPARPRALSVAQ